jgi:hypothetical protein
MSGSGSRLYFRAGISKKGEDAMTDDMKQPTCGQGLAWNSILPEKLGALAAALARVLAAHMQALDLGDVNSKQEYEAYKDLVRQLRQAAAGLESTAQEMTGYRNLPMGRHDEQVAAGTAVFESFSGYVQRKQELLDYLQETIDEERKMLEGW